MNTIYDTEYGIGSYLDLMDRLEDLDYTVIAQGKQRRWDGVGDAGYYGKLTTLIEKISDYDSLLISEVKGHLYIDASDHDGYLYFEIKKVNDKGIDYFDKWQEKWHISEKKCHEILFKRMSVLPRLSKYI